MKPTTARILTLLTLTSAGCVSAGKYDEAVAKAQLTQAELDRTRSSLDGTTADLRKREEQAQALQAQIDEITKAAHDDRSKSVKNLDELRKRLDELRAARAASEKRAALYRSFALKLKAQVDAGDIQVTVRDGRMVVMLPNDVLFDTGRTEIKRPAQDALKAIAGVLRSEPDRHFQVAGHTDNVPIRTDRFPSNWELSTGRALRVMHFLKEQGVPAATLSAAGYADVDPIGPNDTPEGRKQNRRTEITLQPDITDLMPLP
jgi:chemotaxis protein MotB